MDNQLLIELIKITPTLLLYTVILIVFLRYRKPFVEGVLPKISGFKAFGFEASFVREGIESAARSANKIGVQASSSLLNRLSYYQKRALRVLWVDDNPDTVMYESGVLQSLGMQLEFAKTSVNAMDRMGREKFQLVISDINRGGHQTAGLDFMRDMRTHQMQVPMIFYVSTLDPAKGVPPGAFGITDDPNELIHLVLDVAERM
ncbi:MAG: response regulator [Saprospiraceae bacterium]